MKKTLWILMLGLCVGFVATAQYVGVPVADANGCPATTIWDEEEEDYVPYNWTTQMTPIPGIRNSEWTSVPYVPDVVTFRAPGTYDFCAYLDIIFCSLGPVAAVVPEVADFAFLIQCVYADINGPLDLDADIPVTGNGMPDGQYELAILGAVLNDVDHPLHAAATASFQGYFVEIKNMVMEALSVAELKTDKDVRGVLYAAAPHVASALSGVLAAFAVMGDEQTNAALDELLGLLSDIGLDAPEGGIGALGVPVPAVGPNGDIDGDGFTNMQEYNYFVGVLEYSPAEFVAAALDPTAYPPAVLQINGPAGRAVPLGTNVTISVQVLLGTGIAYQWHKDGVALPLETGSAIQINNAQVDDSGVYRVDVTVENKGTEVHSASFTLNVSEFAVPVGGALGLSLFAGACALAGAMGLRRRK